MMRQRWGHRLVGVHEGVDLARTDWVRRGDELHHPVLLIHSADDEFVPCGPSRELARARPDLVTFVEWHLARHCKEWDTGPSAGSASSATSRRADPGTPVAVVGHGSHCPSSGWGPSSSAATT